MRQWKIIVVGSGPSGSATALALAQRRPELARATLLLDRAVHPRVKLCGGGVTPLADAQLRAMAAHADVPAVPIWRARFHVRGYGLEIEGTRQPLFRVVDRRLFDQALAQEAVARGATLHEGEAVRDVAVHASGVTVTTNRGQYEADALVAADGAKSTVRRRLLPPGPSRQPRISRLMEVLTPESPDHPLFQQQCAEFDFSGLTLGVQGYCWNFPSLREGTTVMNRGIFDSRVAPEAPRADLRQALDEFMQPERALADHRLMGHPERWYHPRTTVHLPRVLFVGEAAGIEPFAGEGIGFALGYGRLAADELVEAFESGSFAFDGYDHRLRRSAIGRSMNRRRLAAAVLYRLRSVIVWRAGFALTRLVSRLITPPDATVRLLDPTRQPSPSAT